MRHLFILLSICLPVFCTEPAIEESRDREKLLFLASGEWVAKSLYAATELDLAGHLYHAPKTISKLALLTSCSQDYLYRLMRMLASQGIFDEKEGRLFSNTSASELLAQDHPQSLRSLILLYGREMSQSWSKLSHSLREGTPAFDNMFGESVFAYFRGHPQTAALFNAAMREKSKVVIASCLKSFDFSRFNSIYDIGGGMGHFLQALMRANPKMQGVLFDLPEVVDAASKNGPDERCAFIAGNFFDTVASGGDAYLLKSVLHDWTDDEALKILINCRNAMKEGAKLLIVEPVMRNTNEPDYAKLMDVYMMIITGGKERTLLDFQNLLQRAGFTIESVTSTETEFSIIQARKTD
jgi:hypothetical protein